MFSILEVALNSYYGALKKLVFQKAMMVFEIKTIHKVGCSRFARLKSFRDDHANHYSSLCPLLK
jgi:hypothetical protein